MFRHIVAALVGSVSAQLVIDYEALKGNLNELPFGKTPEEFRQKVAAEYASKNQKASTSTDGTFIVSHAAGGDGLCDPTVDQHSGSVAFRRGWFSHKAYFFWMFESRTSPEDDPLVIWLTGGPGCSSQLALLSENGPCNVNPDGKTTRINKHGWNTKANVIWVDQPAGVGFSTGDTNDMDEDMVATDFLNFMYAFFEQPALLKYKGKPLYITGESFGGHYVPAIAHALWETGDFNLKGIAVGNGLTNPEEQYKWYPEMALDGGKKYGGTLQKGVITNEMVQGMMRAGVDPCVEQIQACNNKKFESCLFAFTLCNYALSVPYSLTGMNVYDMRIPCEIPGLCYNFSMVATFLNTPEVRKSIGAVGETEKWGSCNFEVNHVMQGDFMRGYHQLIPPMLAGGVDVLIYAGDVDYICNWLGNKMWTLALDWPGRAGFNKAEDKPYKVAGLDAGRFRTHQKFSFMQIFQAGHMVPGDQPEAALQMLNDFLAGKISAAQDEEAVQV